ncbi:MAG: hypothetical protein NTW87_19570 [Planctomycetota bacterium]|nr:hypothetical protein [Planctomycetota bacterium]
MKVPYQNWSPVPRCLLFGRKPFGVIEVFAYLQRLQLAAERKPQHAPITVRPSVVARRTGLALWGVKRAVRWLQASGMVLVSRTTHGVHGRGVNSYRIDWQALSNVEAAELLAHTAQAEETRKKDREARTEAGEQAEVSRPGNHTGVSRPSNHTWDAGQPYLVDRAAHVV